MKGLNLSVFIIAYLFLVSILWAGNDFEIGVSVISNSPLNESGLSGVVEPGNWSYGGHLAWSPSILYLSWDAFYLPKKTAYDMTIKMQGDPAFMDLENSECIVNFIDAGVRLVFLAGKQCYTAPEAEGGESAANQLGEIGGVGVLSSHRAHLGLPPRLGKRALGFQQPQVVGQPVRMAG